jgi:hypothetical protein
VEGETGRERERKRNMGAWISGEGAEEGF